MAKSTAQLAEERRKKAEQASRKSFAEKKKLLKERGDPSRRVKRDVSVAEPVKEPSPTVTEKTTAPKGKEETRIIDGVETRFDPLTKRFKPIGEEDKGLETAADAEARILAEQREKLTLEKRGAAKTELEQKISSAERKLKEEQERVRVEENLQTGAVTQRFTAGREGATATTTGGLKSAIGADVKRRAETARFQLQDFSNNIQASKGKLLRAIREDNIGDREDALAEIKDIEDKIAALETEEAKLTASANNNMLDFFEGMGIENLAGLPADSVASLADSFGADAEFGLAMHSVSSQIKDAKTPEETTELQGLMNQIIGDRELKDLGDKEKTARAVGLIDQAFADEKIPRAIADSMKEALGVEPEGVSIFSAPGSGEVGSELSQAAKSGFEDFSMEGFSPEGAPAKGWRTDRHNNPTAFTTAIAKQAGLVEGVDYIKGDAFPDNPNLFTATILGDAIDTTKQVIDKIGFYTGAGQQRWTHTAMGNQEWNALDSSGKDAVIAEMYRNEKGDGSLINPRKPSEPPVSALMTQFINVAEDQKDLEALLKGQGATDEDIKLASHMFLQKKFIPEEMQAKVASLIPIHPIYQGTKTSNKEMEIISQDIVRILKKGGGMTDVIIGALEDKGLPFKDLAIDLATLSSNPILGEAFNRRFAITVPLNSGRPDQAITNVENGLMKAAGGTDKNIRIPIETITKGLAIKELLKEVDPDLLGAWDSVAFKFLTKPTLASFPDSTKEEVIKAQKLQSKIAGMVAPYRLDKLGTAVTKTEEQFLRPLIPDLFDQPEIIDAKVDEFMNEVLSAHNAARSSVGLPQVTNDQLLNPHSRLDAYTQAREGEQVTVDKTSFSDANLLDMYNNGTVEADQNQIDFYEAGDFQSLANFLEEEMTQETNNQ